MHELLYTTMLTARWTALICCGISLTFCGCAASDPAPVQQLPTSEQPSEQPSETSIDVVQIETVTTVQSSAGSFLSPTPEQLLPAYVERNREDSAALAQLQERAKIDVALLIRGGQTGSAPKELDARLVSASAAPWSGMEHCFPHVERSGAGFLWPLALSSVAAELDSTVSPEWRAWQDFRGLGVRSNTQPTEASAPVATLDFQTSGLSSPLLLSAQGDSLLVTNRSARAIARALLIYSHPGGVGVTVIEALNPGERRVTVLGPKEHPPDTLLELAREQLTDFFAASVGAELAPPMAAAKSIPFLETQGMRLIALLSDELEPAALSFSAPVSKQQRVVISHSEILKPEEEARVLGVVMDPSVGVDQALATFGRFTQAKLEFAAQSADASLSAKALGLLTQLRNR